MTRKRLLHIFVACAIWAAASIDAVAQRGSRPPSCPRDRRRPSARRTCFASETLEPLRGPYRRRLGTGDVADKGERWSGILGSGRHRRRHIDPRGELPRQRTDELDLLVRKDFADRLQRHVAFAAGQRLSASPRVLTGLFTPGKLRPLDHVLLDDSRDHAAAGGIRAHRPPSRSAARPPASRPSRCRDARARRASARPISARPSGVNVPGLTPPSGDSVLISSNGSMMTSGGGVTVVIVVYDAPHPDRRHRHLRSGLFRRRRPRDRVARRCRPRPEWTRISAAGACAAMRAAATKTRQP